MKISRILAESDTDKNKPGIYKSHCYGPVYDQLFKSFKKQERIKLIEIGTDRGASLLAWRKFFPNAVITGVDIEDKVEKKEEDIEYIISDVKDLKISWDFDIVIDDGSHKMKDVLYTVQNFRLKRGGIMILEDCQAPGHWQKAIKEVTDYTMEAIDLRGVYDKHDDFLIVLRNYGYTK